MLSRRRQGWCVAALGALILAATGVASGNPHFLIDSVSRRQNALNAGQIEPMTAAEWGSADEDFGDAPDPSYPTLLPNGARHVIVPGFFLGALIDAEADGQPDLAATGDDLAGLDDEDGVVFTSLLIVGQPATVDVTASAAGLLSAWVDFNANGSWGDAGEQVFVDVPLVAGLNPLAFPVPTFAVVGPTFARFRFSTVAGLSFSGPASDGEVEDYQVRIQPPPPPVILAVASVATHGALNVEVPLPIDPPGPPGSSNLEPRRVVVSGKANAFLNVKFDKPMQVGPQSVSSNPPILGITATGDGSQVVKVTFPSGVADEVCYRISLAGSVATDGGVADASANFCVCYNEGDANRFPAVNTLDKQLVTSIANWNKNVPAPPPVAMDPQTDLDRSGVVNTLDKQVVTSIANWGHSPAPCPP